VVGILDHGSLRVRDLAGEDVSDLSDGRHVAAGGDDERRDADLAEPID
jgi:hypothetical protein